MAPSCCQGKRSGLTNAASRAGDPGNFARETGHVDFPFVVVDIIIGVGQATASPSTKRKS